MELTLANIFSNFLVLGFKSFEWEIENFVSIIQFLFLIFPKFLSTKWKSLWRKMPEPSTFGAETCNKGTFGDEKRITIGIGEINLVMGRMGILDELEDNIGNKSLGEEDFMTLFDEEEPSLDEIKETFGVFDVNKDGFIDAFELQGVFGNLGLKEGCKLEDCERMIKAFDCNGDGVIDCKEFVKLMEKCLW